MTDYSICIPRIFNNIPDNKITSTFENLNLGIIKNIDIVRKISRDGTVLKMAFVHFESWNYYNSSAVNLRNKIEDPTVVAKLVYDDPWHWILLPNTSNVSTNSNNTTSPYTQGSSLTTKLNEPTTTWIEERLTNLENELHCVYEELYQREYIPTKYLQKSTWSDEVESNTDSGKSSSVMPMDIHDLDLDSNSSYSFEEEINMNLCEELHKTPNPANYIPFDNDDITTESTESQYYDNEQYDYSSGIKNDYNSSRSNDTSKSYLDTVNQNRKLWITANYCGND